MLIGLLGPAWGHADPENPQPGLKYEMAVIELMGAVRYFHPSEEIETADWDSVLQAALEISTSAEDANELVEGLIELLEPLVRDLVVSEVPTGARNCPEGQDALRWVHYGFAAPPAWMPEHQEERYSSRRASWPSDDTGVNARSLEEWHTVALPGGSVSFPLSLCEDEAAMTDAGRASIKEMGSMPISFDQMDVPAMARLQVATLWPVLKHFYPYQETVTNDWSSILKQGLADARRAETRDDLVKVIQRLTEPLVDGHVSVRDIERDVQTGWLPFDFTWDGEAAMVVAATEEAGVRAGDRILFVDGESINALRQRHEELISGSPQLKNLRAQSAILQDVRGKSRRLVIDDGDNRRTVEIAHSLRQRHEADKPAAFRFLNDSVAYLDLTRLDEEGVRENLPALVEASGIVLDLRGYPQRNHFILGHLLETQDDWGDWIRILTARGPGGDLVETTFLDWELPAVLPRIKAPVVLLTDSSAISYSESVVSLIKYHGLATVVGEPTAGANGNFRPLRLPGELLVVYTGMYVVGPDDQPYHGKGLQPHIEVRPTAEELAEGRDEVLEYGLRELETQIGSDRDTSK